MKWRSALAWQIEFEADAERELKKLDRQVARRILKFLRERVVALDNPRRIGAALVGSTLGNYWKYRVGDYRIIAVKLYLKGIVDFAQLIKVYGVNRDGEQRYSPAEVVDSVPVKIMGRPDSDRICTSHIERHNLSIRMGMRRMTRLTNGFSKKWENLEAAYSLWFAYYNFCRVHQTLRVTPAMEAGIAGHVWTIAELIA
jgi:mRNA-degrading endonuclease RelE of RelBE toxin-antitoxin system